jgi:hypothetical protein
MHFVKIVATYLLYKLKKAVTFNPPKKQTSLQINNGCCPKEKQCFKLEIRVVAPVALLFSAGDHKS